MECSGKQWCSDVEMKLPQYRMRLQAFVLNKNRDFFLWFMSFKELTGNVGHV